MELKRFVGKLYCVSDASAVSLFLQFHKMLNVQLLDCGPALGFLDMLSLESDVK